MIIGIDARVIKYRNIGVTRYTENLIRNLSKIDKMNKYKIFVYNNDHNFLSGLGSNFSFIKTKVSLFSPFEKYFFPYIIKKANIDIFHSPYYFIPFIKMCPTIVTIHDTISFIYKTSFLHQIERWHHKQVLKYADHIITVSKYSKKDIESYLAIKSENISVIYNGTDFKSANKISELKYGDYLLYVGSLQVYKNVGILLKAFRRIKKEYKYLNLVIVTHNTVGINARKAIKKMIHNGNKDRHGIHIARLKIMNKDRLDALNKILKTKDRGKSEI